MKEILKSLGICALSVFITRELVPAVKITNLNIFIILAGLIFLANFIIGSLTKILFFLPNNILIFNLAQIFGNFTVLYWVSKNFGEFQITEFYFGGGTAFGISLTAYSLTAIQATILAAVLISIIFNFLSWLTD